MQWLFGKVHQDVSTRLGKPYLVISRIFTNHPKQARLWILPVIEMAVVLFPKILQRPAENPFKTARLPLSSLCCQIHPYRCQAMLRPTRFGSIGLNRVKTASNCMIYYCELSPKFWTTALGIDAFNKEINPLSTSRSTRSSRAIMCSPRFCVIQNRIFSRLEYSARQVRDTASGTSQKCQANDQTNYPK